MKKRWLTGIVFLILLINLSGCRMFLKWTYGIKILDHFDQKAYVKFIKNKDLQCHLDTLHRTVTYKAMKKYAFSGDSIITQKNLTQPVQMLYYQNDTLVSFHANCYFKGKLNGVDWNYGNRFSVFPAKTSVPFKVDTADIYYLGKTLNNLQLHIKPGKEYTVLVLWTDMVRKISRQAIKTVIRNIESSGKKDRTTLILVNTDRFYIHLNNRSQKESSAR